MFEAADEIERLRAENTAQLAELHAISDALGTNEGHSSVDHILELRQQRDELYSALKAVMASAPYCLKQAQEALAKIEGDGK